MELRHLRYFVAVAEELHFGRAAERLHVSQPAMSQQIIALEKELGASLFRRDSQAVALTAAGTALLQHARRALSAAQEGVDAARLAAHGPTGVLSIGLPETQAAVSIATRGIAAFRLAHPGVELRTSGLPWLEQLKAVAEKKLDLGFCWTGDEQDPDRLPFGLSGRRLIDDPGEFALVPAHHVLASTKSVSLEQLKPYPFGIYERRLHPPLYDHLIRHLQVGGLREVEGAPGVTSAAGSASLVLARGGWTFVSRLVAQEAPAGVAARRIDGISAPAGLEVIWRTDDRRWIVSELTKAIGSAASG